MLSKEITVAVLLGVSIAAAVSLVGLVRGGAVLAFIVATTMILIVIVGSVIGMSLPFVLTRFKMDPASASAPLITSIDRKSTRLNSSHVAISYAVFCLKKKIKEE